MEITLRLLILIRIRSLMSFLMPTFIFLYWTYWTFVQSVPALVLIAIGLELLIWSNIFRGVSDCVVSSYCKSMLPKWSSDMKENWAVDWKAAPSSPWWSSATCASSHPHSSPDSVTWGSKWPPTRVRPLTSLRQETLLSLLELMQT